MPSVVVLIRCGLVLALAGLFAIAWRACQPPRVSASPVVSAAVVRVPPQADAGRIDLRLNPFRLDRKAEVAPRTQLGSAPPPSAPAPRLTGIIWSAPPIAVVEGLPGSDGAVILRKGQTAFGTTLDRIDRTGVRLVTGATIWHLAIREGTAP